MATRQIIVLEKLSGDSDDTSTAAKQWKLALWLDVPAQRQPFYANPSATSQFKLIDQPPAGELQAIKDGAVVEEIHVLSRREGSTQQDMMDDAQELWTKRQNALNKRDTWKRYGSFGTFDGTTWTWTVSGVN